MRGRAQRDSPVFVLLTLPGEDDWMIRQLVQCTFRKPGYR